LILKFEMLKTQVAQLLSVVIISGLTLNAAEIGSFPIKRELTSTKLIFPDKIVVEKYEDPKVKGVTCYVSSVAKGGATGAVGIATDPSDAALSCVRTGAVSMGDIDKSSKGEIAFSEKQSIFFKTFRVRRFFDPVAKTLVYVGYTDKAIMNGSYKSSISAVALGD